MSRLVARSLRSVLDRLQCLKRLQLQLQLQLRERTQEPPALEPMQLPPPYWALAQPKRGSRQAPVRQLLPRQPLALQA